MTRKSTESAAKRKAANGKPDKPYSGFPLFPHATGRWAKKINGRFHYFGKWRGEPDNGWRAALDEYLEVKDDLYAGRKPRRGGDGVTIRDLCNRFLTHCQKKIESDEIVQRTFDDYKRTTDRIVRVLGLSRRVDDLRPDDFARLRDDIAKNYGVVALGNEITRGRVVFNYAYKDQLIKAPVRYGLSFQRPSKKSLRQAKSKNGKRMFEASDCRTLIDNAQTPELKAMVLLGLNCGFGNRDCAKLSVDAVDLDGGWIDYPRSKTGIDRRCPLWSETIEAINKAIKRRSQARELVFVTKYGNTYEDDQACITKEFRNLLDSLKLHRKGLGFYALRHTFRTIVDATRDFPAVRLIMGHVDESIDAHYRKHIGDDRLKTVVDHMHLWLFESDEGG